MAHIQQNPVKAGLVETAEEVTFSSAHALARVDPMPEWWAKAQGCEGRGYSMGPLARRDLVGRGPVIAFIGDAGDLEVCDLPGAVGVALIDARVAEEAA